MKRDIWKQLKKQNDGRQLNLEVSDQKYIDKVTAYAVNQGVGMMETEIIRKDLIGMGFEAKKEGKLLEQRLGDVGEFARELVDAGKAENRKEEKYYFIQSIGFVYLFAGVLMFFMSMTKAGWNMLEDSAFNLVSISWIVLVPWLLSVWQMYFIGRFVLVKKIGGILTVLAAGMILVLNWVYHYFFDDIKGFGNQAVPNWIFLLFLLLGGVLYWHGRKKFTEITEQIAKEQHIEF